jgi:hypothetical protein
MLSQVDKMLLTKFMGKKKAEETDKLYADQVRRYRNRNNR